MKFSLASISAVAAMAISTVSGAAIIPRNDASNQNQTWSDIGALNGTWYFTGVTENIWNIYTTMQKTMNIKINCPQLDIAKSSNTSFNILGSAFLNHNGTAVGVNATEAGTFMLQQPDSSVKVTDSEHSWTFYASQVFVNIDQWNSFTSNGNNKDNATSGGSGAIPGTKPFKATVYIKLIDSNAQPGTNSTNYDTIFLWGTEAYLLDPSSSQKRADQVYGVILSKDSSVSADTFKKTVALLPAQISQNNIGLVLLDNSCHNNTQH